MERPGVLRAGSSALCWRMRMEVELEVLRAKGLRRPAGSCDFVLCGKESTGSVSNLEYEACFGSSGERCWNDLGGFLS